MDLTENNALKKRIKELELEVQSREVDLSRFRVEISTVNKKLEKLIYDLNYELKMAHKIQKLLVPTDLPNISGFDFSSKFLPSNISGGDYFDIFEHQDKFRFGIIVAASSGYSMSALLMSVLLQLTGQLEARKGTDPHKLLEIMLREMAPNIEMGDSADIFYAVVDRRSYEMGYCRAGTVICLLQEHSTGELKLLESCTAAISSDQKGPFASSTLSLNPNDRLIFCTRGVIETKNLDGEEFGQERLYQCILSGPANGVHELRNKILYEIQKFSNGCEAPRDVTVIITEIKDRVIKLAKK